MTEINAEDTTSKPDKNDEEGNGGDVEEEEEEEEEDVDFNPFVKETVSPEASSSLSSEVEGLDGNSPSKSKKTKDKVAEVESRPAGDPIQDSSGSSKKRKSVEEEEEDAICKRTRAKYSLASFTLDELETFLQETDDEDDLHHNVDDEEEYRKFLAAVLQGGDGDGIVNEENANVDDDDEDVDDADFEIELEELLESDVDDGGKGGGEKTGQRRETRQKRRQNVSAQYKKKLLEQSKRPLRPLPLRPMPLRPVILFLPNGGGGKALTSNEAAAAPSNAASEEGGLINGFTPLQIGQLHCLIHEHVQLLIQLFSLCVLDSSRQPIASQVQGLIFEMLHKRDEVIACKSVPYPGNCFRPLHICRSVSDEPNLLPAHCSFESPPTLNLQMPVSQNSSLLQSRGDELAFNGQTSSSPTAGSFWLPFINGPILSILDVAPLNLVGRYMDDVYNAVREYRQRCCQNSNPDTWYEKEPLFYLPPPLLCEANGEVLRGNIPPATSTVSASPGEPPQKKTLAASIVESTKKQSIALVPKDISKLAQRFFPLFNPALFPHKPSPSANRVLFTDAEDELLALGIMEYNTDWKAIQQRFLPCKSKHQIFVRQKNRCSSKAPENPIKAVRRMKTSPLTAEEVERIQEGLRVYKLDWLSVWRFAVPHRDPSLLPRQLRIALGTQKSYKQDTAKKEKRRMAEFKKRCKTADLVNWHSNNEGNQAESTGGGNSSGDDCVDNANEAYVHQAFLSDWRPGTTSLISSDTLSREDNREQPNNSGPGEAQPQIGNMHGFSYGSQSYQYPLTHVKPCPPNTTQPKYQNPNLLPNTAKSQVQMLPYRSRRTDGARLVKLAPDLPPVNLPRSVRIISQSAFKGNQCGSSVKVSATGGVPGVAGKDKMVSQLPHIANLRTTSPVKTKQDKSNQPADDVTDSRPEESSGVHNAHNTDERGTDSDLQMHPLLFQATEGGRLPYFPLSCNNGTSSSFSFFSGNQPQLNLSLFPNAHQVNHVVDSLNKSSKTKDSTTVSCGIDFHPLLQRTDEENSNLVMACSNPNQFICLRDQSTQFQNNFDAVQMKSLVKNGPFTADPKRSITSEKANDLDLEIHLSSNSSNEITGGSRDVDANNQPRLIISKPKVGKRVETTDSPSHHHGEHCPTVHSNVVPVADASPVQNNNVSMFNIDGIGDQSHPEIVMEQEELSDSDEEVEEHVEFECEEMDDSDGEDGAGCETVDEVQDQDVPSFAMQEVTADEDDGGQLFELGSPVNNPQGKPSILRKGSPFLKLSLTTIGKETMSSSWLSLDSRTPVDSPSMKSRDKEGTINEGRPAKNLASCRSNRLCKKTTTSTTNDAQKNFSDMAKQLSLGPLAVSTLRKPRKRASRTNTNLGTGMTSENGRYNVNKLG